MPELGEVSYYANQWKSGLSQCVGLVRGHAQANVFKESSLRKIQKHLKGKNLKRIGRRAKWACFLFSEDTWLSVHLGMTGSLRATSNKNDLDKHCHLCLELKNKELLYF